MQSLNDHRQRGDVDWVVKETDLALRSRPHVTVMPVLVDEAEAPESSELRRRCGLFWIARQSACTITTCSMTSSIWPIGSARSGKA